VALEQRDSEVNTPPAGKLATVLEICVCPDCYSSLEGSGGGLKCSACGHLFEIKDGVPILLPHSNDSTGKRYLANYEAMATDDLAKPFEGNRPARHEKLIEFIGSVRGRRVLDIGSSDATYLRRMDAKQRVALDIAVEYLVKIPEDSGVLAVCGDAEQLPIRAGYFDVVIISDVLEHVLHPERVVEHLTRICGPNTRLIVHVPWEEDLSQYRDASYEFTHLRSFNPFTFQWLFRDFYERRSRGTYPLLTSALPYRLYGVLPRPLYNWMYWMVFMNQPSLGDYAYERHQVWIAELPRRERWLLLFYRPIFRIFELRPWHATRRQRFSKWFGNSKRRLKSGLKHRLKSGLKRRRT
jgi:SAM-dependent methyltransferase